MDNNKTHISDEDFKELHEKLAQTVIDFFKEKCLPENSWAITFGFDDLQSSVDAGKWVPYSGSSMELWDNEKNCLFYEM